MTEEGMTGREKKQLGAPVRCTTCLHWSPKTTDAAMFRLGFARCALLSLSPGHTFSGTYNRDCDRYAAAPMNTVQARRTFELRHDQLLKMRGE